MIPAMSIRLDKSKIPLVESSVGKIPGQLGVYQLYDSQGDMIYIGYAGGHSLFGLRSELEKHLCVPLKSQKLQPQSFCFEVTTAYLTRYQELLMVFLADHDRLPIGNVGQESSLGRLSPS